MFRLSLIAVCASAALAADIPQGAHLLLRMQNTITSRTAKEGDYVYLQTATPLAANGAIVIPVGTYVQGVVARVERAGRVAGTGELGIRLEAFTFPDGRVMRMSPRVTSVDPGPMGGQGVYGPRFGIGIAPVGMPVGGVGGSTQQVTDNDGTIEAGATKGRDAATIAVMSGTGALIGSFAGRWTSRGRNFSGRNAGIGAGIGAAAGLAAVMLTRGQDAYLAQGSSVDIVFDQPVTVQ